MPRTSSEEKVRQFSNEPLRPGDPRLRVKGNLLIIGGHEDKEGDKLVLRELAALVDDGKLVVCTVASDAPDEMWEMYESVLRGLGIPHIHHLHIETREDASSPRAMRAPLRDRESSSPRSESRPWWLESSRPRA